MNKNDLAKVLDLHKLWLFEDPKGICADLQNANLRNADLRGANLRGADLWGANLRGADLWSADLQGADLQNADLRNADLWGADFQNADLWGADLQNADLRNANLDFSSGIPFRCGGTKIKGDRRLFAQMVFHLTRQDWQELSEQEQTWLNAIPAEILNSFCEHRSDVAPVIQEENNGL